MPEIGGKRIAGSLVDDIKSTVAREMSKARGIIGEAVDALATEIRNGSEMVARAVRQEAQAVRDEFGEIIGNAHDAAEEAVDNAKKITATAATQPKAETPAANPTPPAPPAGVNGQAVPGS